MGDSNSEKTSNDRKKQTTQEQLNDMVQRCKEFDASARYLPPPRNFFTTRVLKEKIGNRNRDALSPNLTQSVAQKYAIDHPDNPQLNSPSSITESIPASLSDFSATDTNEILAYFKSTVHELKQNNSLLTKVAQRQQSLTETLGAEVIACKKRISDLELEVDSLKQDKFANQVLVSGPAAKDFIARTSEHRNNSRHLGFHSINKLRTMIALKTIDTEILSEKVLDFRRSDAVTKRTEELLQSGASLDNPDDAAAIRNAANDVIVTTEITGDDVEVRSLIVDQGIEDAFIVGDDRLAVHTTSRTSAMEILTCGKRTQRTLFFSEQLTKRRQELQYKLRQIRNANPDLGISVFSRNGIPAVRVGQARPVFVLTDADLQIFVNSLRGYPNHRSTRF